MNIMYKLRLTTYNQIQHNLYNVEGSGRRTTSRIPKTQTPS